MLLLPWYTVRRIWTAQRCTGICNPGCMDCEKLQLPAVQLVDLGTATHSLAALHSRCHCAAVAPCLPWRTRDTIGLRRGSLVGKPVAFRSISGRQCAVPKVHALNRTIHGFLCPPVLASGEPSHALSMAVSVAFDLRLVRGSRRMSTAVLSRQSVLFELRRIFVLRSYC